MTAYHPQTTPNGTEHVRTTMTDQNLPIPTKPNHQNPTISSKTRRLRRDAPQENCLFDHLPTAEIAARPNNGPPTSATEQLQRSPNAAEQVRTAMTDQNHPKPTKTDHPDRAISCKSLVFPLPSLREQFLPDHHPAAKTHAHSNNARPDNPSDAVRSGRVV